MKSLTITLSLLCSLLLSANTFASESTVVAHGGPIETITVVSKPEPANFEVFSLSHAEATLDNVIEIMVDSFEVVEETAKLLDLGLSAGS